MIKPNISRVLDKLGFYNVEQRANTIVVGHLHDLMIDALHVDLQGNIVGGPYADLVIKAMHALDLYDAEADRYSYLPPSMRDQFIANISTKSNLSLEIVRKLTGRP